MQARTHTDVLIFERLVKLSLNQIRTPASTFPFRVLTVTTIYTVITAAKPLAMTPQTWRLLFTFEAIVYAE